MQQKINYLSRFRGEDFLVGNVVHRFWFYVGCAMVTTTTSVLVAFVSILMLIRTYNTEYSTVSQRSSTNSIEQINTITKQAKYRFDQISMTSTATSGSRCQFSKVRSFDRRELLFSGNPIAGEIHASDSSSLSTNEAGLDNGTSFNQSHFYLGKKCRYWGTLTTIFNTTEAVLKLPEDWCLVVAMDIKSPSLYGREGDNTVILTVEKQKELADNFEFVNLLPWNHFSRKNVAYLFAVLNGAEWIWDFDDDNILYRTPNVDNFQAGVLLNPRDKASCHAINPYLFLNSKSMGEQDERLLWPRGYPLDLIHSNACDAVSMCDFGGSEGNDAMSDVGIFQSFADGDPDVDAIYRLTQKLPIHFERESQELGIGNEVQLKALLLPRGIMSPTNSQAALVHVPLAAWSLFLPTTVHGRISDIWRGYFAQAIGRHFGMRMAFLSEPLVYQNRNSHDALADFNAEVPLYECSGALIELLNSRQAPLANMTLPEALTSLYVDLYEYGILEWEDIELVHHWLRSLSAVGYKFPVWKDISEGGEEDGYDSSTSTNKSLSCTPIVPFSIRNHESTISREDEKQEEVSDTEVLSSTPTNDTWQTTNTSSKRYKDIVLVGQFNYDTDPSQVAHWVERWTDLFDKIVVCGPFNSSNYATIKDDLGLDVVKYIFDYGWYSPFSNLAQVLVRFASDPSIKGVMMSHDDLIFNVSNLDNRGFPNDGKILMQSSYFDLFSPKFFFSNNYTLRLANLKDTNNNTQSPFVSVNDFKTLRFDGKRWAWWKRTIPTFGKATSKDKRAVQFANNDGTFSLYTPGASDFVYIPIMYAKAFNDVATWLLDNKVFLEVAMPTIVGYLKDHFNASVTTVGTCTTWNLKDRADGSFVNNCIEKEPNYHYDIFHPVKLFSLGKTKWDAYFDKIVKI